MKLKFSLLLLSISFILLSCSDDDDPSYEWKTTWTVSTLNSNDLSAISVDTVVNNIQSTTEANVISVIQDPSSFRITIKDKDGNSLVVKDERQIDGDIKFRDVIVYTADSRYLKQEKIIYQKID